MRVIGVFVGFVLVALAVAAPVSAKNDKFPVGDNPPPFPAAWCGLPGTDIVVSVDRNRSKANPIVLDDGSVQFRITGNLVETVTNPVNDKSVTVNVSGPGTFTFPPDFSTLAVVGSGRWAITASNLTDFGFPSNAVITTGSLEFTQINGSNEIETSPVLPNVVMDLCAALA
jgi:hypothetical protein